VTDVSHIAEDFGGEVRLADSTINNIGGHDLHVEGGADLMWKQVGHLTMALREMCAEIDRLRAYTCPDCGRPGVTVMRQGDDSPFLKHVLASGGAV
jgi:hypothetical protein